MSRGSYGSESEDSRVAVFHRWSMESEGVATEYNLRTPLLRITQNHAII